MPQRCDTSFLRKKELAEPTESAETVIATAAAEQKQDPDNVQLQSLPPPNPPFPPQQDVKRRMMMIHVQQLLFPSLQEHPPPQFVADKSLMLGAS